MLELKGIGKEYITGDTKVDALKNINLTFRKNEFVAILGPSGCGKTTMLNIVGGLDKYSSGDLIIRNRSTKDFKPYDWDAYRNSCVGFVFQNYNLIPHQTVLGNVELALTLSGKSKAERRARAEEALEKVGLLDQIKKRPNQLSGGQMQRVAIARAIVNNPEIILADEPTGALDSKTSVQVADLLKEIAKERLVIMVTHNDELAAKYATRVIRLLDGHLVSDSNPFTPSKEELKETEAAQVVQAPTAETLTGKAAEKALKKKRKAEEKAKKSAFNKTAMSYGTALSLSFNNLKTKKGRTFMTAFAGSIGIIGIALVLSISNGFTNYIGQMQSGTLAGFPITVSQYTVDKDTLNEQLSGRPNVDLEEFPEDGKITVYEPNNMKMHYNAINKDYLEYVKNIDPKHYNDISYTYGMTTNVLKKLEVKEGENSVTQYKKVTTFTNDMMSQITGSKAGNWNELATGKDFILSQYDVISGQYPTEKNELALIVDKYNRISTTALKNIYLTQDELNGKKLQDLVGIEFKAVTNDDWYMFDEASGIRGKFLEPASASYQSIYEKEDNLTLKIVGIMRVRSDAPLSLYNTGVVYTPKLSQYLLENAKTSEIGARQFAESDYNYITGQTFKMDAAMAGGIAGGSGVNAEFSATMIREGVLQKVGVSDIPTSILIYPKDFESKKEINTYLDAYNNNVADDKQILYMDAASLLSDTMGTMINIITIALSAFGAVSLVVSSIMIGIITYVSVIERTKEIGVLRSIGARKKDISRVFNAETMLIGLVAGLLGVGIAFIMTFPVSAIIKNFAGGMVTTNLAVLNPIAALVLVVISMGLTLIAGAIPSRMAAKKDPVVALRTE